MRSKVLEVKCDRCSRVENRVEDPDNLDQPPPALIVEANLPEHIPLRFDDLCSPCARSVRQLLAQIAKKIEGVSPDRKKGLSAGGSSDPPSSGQDSK